MLSSLSVGFFGLSFIYSLANVASLNMFFYSVYLTIGLSLIFGIIEHIIAKKVNSTLVQREGFSKVEY